MIGVSADPRLSFHEAAALGTTLAVGIEERTVATRLHTLFPDLRRCPAMTQCLPGGTNHSPGHLSNGGSDLASGLGVLFSHAMQLIVTLFGPR